MGFITVSFPIIRVVKGRFSLEHKINCQLVQQKWVTVLAISQAIDFYWNCKHKNLICFLNSEIKSSRTILETVKEKITGEKYIDPLVRRKNRNFKHAKKCHCKYFRVCLEMQQIET